MMWLFVKRYFGWYLWLGLFTTVIGAIIGCTLSGGVFLFFIAILFGFKLGVIFAAPVNLVILPIAFHLARGSSQRASIMRLSGGIAGCLTPVIAIYVLRRVAPEILLLGWQESSPAHDLSLLLVMAVGTAVGIWCGRFFERHGDRYKDAPSIFDVNAALEAAREQK